MDSALNLFWVQPWWIKVPALFAAVYAVIVLVLAIGRAIALVIRGLLRGALAFIHWFSDAVSQGILAALRALGRLLLRLLWLAFWPFLWAWDQIAGSVGRVVENVEGRIDEARDLRALWQQDYRDQFKTFKAFKKAFAAGSPVDDQAGAPPENKPQNEPRAKEPDGRREPGFAPSAGDGGADPFVEACRLFDLPEDGAFTQEELNRKYRQKMLEAHPDRGGSDELAKAVNEARGLIRMRKMWLL